MFNFYLVLRELIDHPIRCFANPLVTYLFPSQGFSCAACASEPCTGPAFTQKAIMKGGARSATPRRE